MTHRTSRKCDHVTSFNYFLKCHFTHKVFEISFYRSLVKSNDLAIGHFLNDNPILLLGYIQFPSVERLVIVESGFPLPMF